ncbi:class I lanthipeptide [Flagellimonas olearia]|uniref:class I lanthipeptide n=1 Tax=Flagellimonas olearia TaxID=552546 RepID=UPI00101C37C4|nr:class I lanthipeptide [Allomuricauda olearia]
MKKEKISGKLFIKKQTISNLTSSSITGGGSICPSSACPTSNDNSCSIGCPTDTTNANCTSGTSAAISCC